MGYDGQRFDVDAMRESLTLTFLCGRNGMSYGKKGIVFSVIFETLKENYPGLQYIMGCCCTLCDNECNIEPIWDWKRNIFSTSDVIQCFEKGVCQPFPTRELCHIQSNACECHDTTDLWTEWKRLLDDWRTEKMVKYIDCHELKEVIYQMRRMEAYDQVSVLKKVFFGKGVL